MIQKILFFALPRLSGSSSFDERLVDLQELSADEFPSQRFVESFEQVGAASYPVAHRAAVYDDLLTAVEDLLETIEGQAARYLATIK